MLLSFVPVPAAFALVRHLSIPFAQPHNGPPATFALPAVPSGGVGDVTHAHRLLDDEDLCRRLAVCPARWMYRTWDGAGRFDERFDLEWHDPDGHARRQRCTGRHGCTRSRCCLLYTSPSPRDRTRSRMPSS